MTRRKGPLVTFEENRIVHRLRRIKVFTQKFPLVAAVGIGRNKTGENLHVTAGNIPAELDGSQSVLGFSQITALRTRFDGKTDAAGMDGGIDTGRLDPARTADGEYGVFGLDDFKISRFAVDKHRSADPCLLLVGE